MVIFIIYDTEYKITDSRNQSLGNRGKYKRLKTITKGIKTLNRPTLNIANS